VATGRNPRALDDLVRRFGPRVAAAVMTGDEEADRRRITELAGGPVDVVLDLLPREASASQVHAAVLAVRPGGRVVLMGGVRHNLELSYNWLMHNEVTVRGQWMYPREAIPRMIGLIKSGLIDLARADVTTFPLDAINQAIDHAALRAGPFEMTVVEP